MQEQDLTAQGMEEGVSQSRNVILFLSDDVMARPFCNAEQRWAKQYSCNFVGVVEQDDRHGGGKDKDGVDIFVRESAKAPKDLRDLFDSVEFEPYQRRAHLAKAMVAQILTRGGVAAVRLMPSPFHLLTV